MTHAPDCHLPPSQEAARAWREEWPNHCRICLGTGSMEQTWETAEGGYARACGFETLTVRVRCDCLDDGRCPRCGLQTGEDELSLPCVSCGWRGAADGCPAEKACTCGFEELTW